MLFLLRSASPEAELLAKRTFRTSTEVCLCSPRVCPIAPQCIRPINVSNNECVPPQPKVTSQASPDRKTLDHLGVHLHQRHLCAHGSVSRRFPRGWRHGRRVAPRKSVLHLELPLSSRTPLPIYRRLLHAGIAGSGRIWASQLALQPAWAGPGRGGQRGGRRKQR